MLCYQSYSTHKCLTSLRNIRYRDRSCFKMVVMLSPAFSLQNQTATASQLASLRLHGLFEDTGSFTSSFAKQLTARHRSALIDTSNPSSVQSVIAKRNKLRQRRGLLAYRYMQPKYLPNSIVI